ncbi:MAG: N-acetylglucosamine kinase [Omnitrophica bacterium GWA2_52_8]|nr:MAG: N-acetylglucosamine kinase [Omnitrophica bacterium GWA2_52_8]
MFHVGIDLGGTKIEGVVLDESHREIFRERIATEREHGYGHILKQIQKLYQSLLKNKDGREHTLGVGTPGTFSRKTGAMINSNTICLNGRPLAGDLEAMLQHRLALENDANCFAVAEALQGAGTGRRVVFGVIMGTGCGGGLVVDGKLWDGLQGIAGEWGHMIIDPSGPECYCGKHGCVETFISGGGLERMYLRETGQTMPLREISALYRKGNEPAVKLMRSFFRNFGVALGNLINILDPEVVVLGGGVSNIDEIYEQGLEEVRKNVFSDKFQTPVVKHRLGDSAGVLGAAWIGIA